LRKALGKEGDVMATPYLVRNGQALEEEQPGE